MTVHQAGNITDIQSELGKTSYGYDPLDRLTEANPDNSLQSLGLPYEMYSYDPLGNRLSSAHQPGIWNYNADNQLTQYPRTTPFNPAAPVDTQVSYTPQGHTKQETNNQSTKDYAYNAAERLIRFANTLQGQTTPQLEAQYRYDPFGRRISKTITQGSSQTTWFLYSEQGLMAEANETGQLTKAYGFNPVAAQQGLWSTDPIWQANVSNDSLTDTSTRYHYLHTDHLGTPMLGTDETGDISWKAIQEAFGAVSVQQHQSRINMNLRFPGQYFDQETGTHYNFQRDYRPNAGRYVQSDPIGMEGGWNVFAYVDSNPLRWFDQEGLAKMCCRLLNSIAGSIGRQRHCYIVADDGTVYGLYPRDGKGVPRINDSRDTGGSCYDCPDDGCSDQNKCLRAAHNNYPIGEYKRLGPNSNTYAGTLAKSCCKGGVPSKVKNSPGVDDSPPL